MDSTSPRSLQDAATGLAYTKRLRWAGELRAFAFFFTLVFCGILGWQKALASLVARVTSNFYLQVLLCWIALGTVCTVLTVPASLYRYHLDRKFQVANTTAGQWLLDFLKGCAVLLAISSTIVGIAFTSGTLLFSFSWLVAAFSCSLFFVFVNRTYPWILSLFYPVVLLSNASLREKLTRLAMRAGLQVGALYEWQVSTRTRRANALVAGMGTARRILLTDTLISSLSEDETEAIVAHELGHCALHHIRNRLIVQGIVFGVAFFLMDLAVRHGLVPFAANTGSWRDLTLLPGFFLYWSCAYIYGTLFLARLARRQEKAADLYSWKLIGRAEPFITAMRKISALNLITYDKKAEWRFMHPPTAERIAAAEAFAEANGEFIGGATPSLAVSPQGS